MKFGVCYYPEHWPEARWVQDAAMMRQAGLEIVRLAEFAWARMEPQEKFMTWSWLDRAIETFAASGMQIVLGTPTAAPPAWLTRTIPRCGGWTQTAVHAITVPAATPAPTATSIVASAAGS